MFTIITLVCAVQVLTLAALLPLTRMAALSRPALNAPAQEGAQEGLTQTALPRTAQPVTYPLVPHTAAQQARMDAVPVTRVAEFVAPEFAQAAAEVAWHHR